jgi:hypothetical protein
VRPFSIACFASTSLSFLGLWSPGCGHAVIVGSRAEVRPWFPQKLSRAPEIQVMGDAQSKGDGPRCVSYGRRVRTPFVQYSAGNIRLMKCVRHTSLPLWSQASKSFVVGCRFVRRIGSGRLSLIPTSMMFMPVLCDSFSLLKTCWFIQPAYKGMYDKTYGFVVFINYKK